MNQVPKHKRFIASDPSILVDFEEKQKLAAEQLNLLVKTCGGVGAVVFGYIYGIVFEDNAPPSDMWVFKGESFDKAGSPRKYFMPSRTTAHGRNLSDTLKNWKRPIWSDLQIAHGAGSEPSEIDGEFLWMTFEKTPDGTYILNVPRNLSWTPSPFYRQILESEYWKIREQFDAD